MDTLKEIAPHLGSAAEYISFGVFSLCVWWLGFITGQKVVYIPDDDDDEDDFKYG